MQILEEYPKEFSDRFYPHQPLNKTTKPRAINKNFKDKKKRLANDIEFNEIVNGLFDLLNEMNKYSKNNARKNKRNLKTRYDITISDPYDKLHKKQKLNTDITVDEMLIGEGDINKSSINEENDWHTKGVQRSLIQQRISLDNGIQHLEKDELKKECKKPGLYRFKDEVEGDKELQLKSLNLLFKKENEKNLDRNENYEIPIQNKFLPNTEEVNQQIFGRIPSLNLFAELLKKIPNFSFDQSGSSHYLNTLSMISDMLENKNDIFTSENLEILNYKNPMINTKSFANLLPPPLMNMNINMNTFNKSQIFPFSMNYPGIRPVEKINENIDDFRYMNQKNLTTPFKRAGTHVAIAYYIYVNKNKSKFNDNKNTNECDPTYHARVLREKKNPSNSPQKTPEENYVSPRVEHLQFPTENLEKIQTENLEKFQDHVNIIEESPNFQLEIASSPKKLEVENNKIELEETKEISKNDINEIEEKIDEEIGNYEKITNLEILDTNNGLFSKIQKNEENEKIECVEKIQIQPIIEIKEQTQINSVEKIIKKDQTSEFNLTLTAILNKIVDEESEIKLERIEDKKNEYTINENSNSFCLNQNLENSKEFINLDEKSDMKLKKKKTKYILDRSLDIQRNKDSLKFKIHLQKSESQFEDGFPSNEEE